jgi:FkbM family methyltransferase
MDSIAQGLIFPRELAERLSEEPIRFVDVGASGGVQPPWKDVEPLLRIIGFEPDRASFEALQNVAPANAIYVNKGLSDHRATVPLYVTRRPGGSSTLRPDAVFLEQFSKGDALDVVATAPCEVDTLDSQLAEVGVDQVDFVKLDTQGTELFVLRGGSRTLQGSVLGVEVEVELNPLYQHQPLLADVDSLLRRFGFELVELVPHWWPRWSGYGLASLGAGQPMWAEAVYLKSPAVWAQTSGLEAVDLERTVTKAVSICLLYGLADCAMDLVDAVSGRISTLARQELSSAIRRQDLAAAKNGVRYEVALSRARVTQMRKLWKRTGVALESQMLQSLNVSLAAQGMPIRAMPDDLIPPTPPSRSGKPKRLALPHELSDRLSKNPLVVVAAGHRSTLEPPWNEVDGLMSLVAFEPHPAWTSADHVAPSRLVSIQKALADHQGSIPFNQTRRGPASIRQPRPSVVARLDTSEAFDVTGTVLHEVTTLDDQVAELNLTEIDVIRLGAHGNELEICRGGAQTLQRSVFGIELEIGLNALYEEQPLLADVDPFLRKLDFELFDFQLRWWKRRSGEGMLSLGRGQPVWARLLYLKNLPHMQEVWRQCDRDQLEQALARAVSVCLLYGRGDYALELVDEAAIHLPVATARRFRNAVRKHDIEASRRGRSWVRGTKEIVGSSEAWLAAQEAAGPVETVALQLEASHVSAIAEVFGRTGTSVRTQILTAIDEWLSAQRY